MTKEEFDYYYATNPRFKARVDSLRDAQARQAKIQKVAETANKVKTTYKYGKKFVDTAKANSIGSIPTSSLTAAPALVGSQVASGVAAPTVANVMNVPFGSIGEMANATQFSTPALQSVGSSVAPEAASSLGGTVSSYLPYVNYALFAYNLADNIRKGMQGSSHQNQNQWTQVMARGGQLMPGWDKQKVGEGNQKFMKSRDENDLTFEDINKVAAPRVQFPDWDRGFTRAQQEDIVNTARAKGLLSEHNGGLEFKNAPEFKDVYALAQKYRQENLGKKGLNPIDPAKAFTANNYPDEKGNVRSVTNEWEQGGEFFDPEARRKFLLAQGLDPETWKPLD